MVSDGGDAFGPGAFGLREASAIVRSASTFLHLIEVVTASTLTSADADVTSFTFSGTHTVAGQQRSLADYDQLWLFGFQRSNSGMTGPPLDAIVQFMSARGGVFATGDHENLGGAMCGEIPRVRSMREWYWNPGPAPAGSGGARIDTNVPRPGADPQFDLQSDSIPQRIYPRWYGVNGSVAHPLLTFSGGTVTYLPDHPHEGRCLEPSSLPAEEWPTDASGAQPRPEVIAYGVSAGPGFDPSKPGVTPPGLFGVIGAYDGHQAGVGRVVVDSTWHHWININLNGAGAFPLSGGVPTNGLYEAGAPTPEYEQIKAYFRNIARWLSPSRTWRCVIFGRLPFLRYQWPLFEELQPQRFDDLAYLVDLGAVVRRTLARVDGDAAVAEVTGALVPEVARPLVDEFAGGEPLELPVGMRPEVVRDAALGGAMAAIGLATPPDADPQVAMEELAADEGRLEGLQVDGAARALDLLRRELEGYAERLEPLRSRLG